MEQKWTYNGETLTRETYGWEVRYPEGIILKQFDDQGAFHRMSEIDQAHVVIWSIVHKDDPTRRIDIMLPAGAQLVHGYQRYGATDGRPQVTVFKFGYIDRSGGKHLNYVMPDGRIIHSEDELNGLVRFD